MKISTCFAALAVVVLASGCVQQSGSPDGAVGGPEDYVYKGKKDQLMSVSAADRAKVLSERFKLIQARN